MRLISSIVLWVSLVLSMPFAMLMVSETAQAQSSDVKTLTAEGRSQNPDGSKARHEAIKDAQEKAAMDEINLILGTAKAEKSKPVITSKIFPQNEKYILNYKTAEPVVKDGETVISVTLKIHTKNLKDLLAREGLLYQSDGPTNILPILVVTEKKDTAKSYRWWIEEHTPQNGVIRENLKNGFKIFDATFRARGLYFVDPVTQHYVQMVPDAYRNPNLTLDDYMWLGQFFKSQMVLQGDVSYEWSPTRSRVVQMDLRLSAYHTGNGRLIGELNRQYESEPGDWDLAVQKVTQSGFSEAARDLSGQIYEEWSKGTFGASVIRLRVTGNVDYKDVESFKKQILSLISDVKSIRERRVETGVLVFEADVVGGASTLAKRLEQTPFSGYLAQISSVDAKQLDIRWKKR